MKLLALDTSSQACSCALLVPDDKCIARHTVAPRGHTKLILGMIESLLAEAQLHLTQLDGIVLGHGPGSFTGLRIGVSVAQGLALGADLPITPISSLRALAQGGLRCYQAHQVVAAFDARLGEVYAGAYRSDGQGLMHCCREDCLIKPERFDFTAPGDWTGMGSAWSVYAVQLQEGLGLKIDRLITDVSPCAVDVVRLGEYEFGNGLKLPAETALPNYLRHQVASPKSVQQRPVDY